MNILEAIVLYSVVADLINMDTMTWKSSLVREIFKEETIPLSPNNRVDQLKWRRTANGMLLIRSAYYLQGKI